VNNAVTVLTGYVMLLMLVPATQTISALGALGTPAIIYAGAALMWLIAGRLMGWLTLSPESSAPRKAMCGFGAAILLSYLAAASRGSSALEIQSADRDVILVATWAGLVIIASAVIRDSASLDRLLRRIVIAGTIVAGMGILEFSGINVVHYIVFPGLQSNIQLASTSVRSNFIRPMATTSQPLEYGGVLAMILPFALQQAFDPARQGPHTRLRRWLPVGLIGFTLPLTVSRTAIIGVVVVLLVLVPTWKRQRRRPAYAIIAVGAVAVKALVPGLLSTIVGLFSTSFSNSDSSTQARAHDYAGVAPYIAERPWFGRGFGTFIPALYRFTDNFYLLAMVEIGVVGVVAVLGLYFTGIHCGRAGRRLHVEATQRELGQSFAAAFAVALVTSATFDTLTFPMFSGLLFLLLGLAGAYLGIARRREAEAQPVAGPVAVP
jgi:O-antigen ligase